MTLTPFAHHGGQLSLARKLYPEAPEPWIDLSTGINPRSFPARRATRSERNRLPQVDELSSLEARAANAFGVADPRNVVAAAGSEAVLRLLPGLLQIGHAALLSHSYSSHLDAWQRAGAAATLVSPETLMTGRYDNICSAVVVVNPNNPDGRAISAPSLLKLHDVVAPSGGALIVDEAFVEVTPEISVAPVAGTSSAPRMIVLRSFGKFYGLAGLRLGFAIAQPAIAARLRALLGDWPICSDALIAGLAAYSDPVWAHLARERLTRASQRLDALLQRSGFAIVGGTSLYRLARSEDAATRFKTLLAAGILARPFAAHPSLLRFGLPGSRSAWQRLAAALE